MQLDRQAAMFYMLVILVIVMGIIAVEIYKLQRDVGGIASSPVVRAVAGFGSGVG